MKGFDKKNRPLPSDTIATASAPTPLTRAWEATRPAEPSEAAWDAIWTRVAADLDRSRPRVFAIPASSRRRRLLAGIVLAQAAAVLAAVTTWLSLARPDQGPATSQKAPTVLTMAPAPPSSSQVEARGVFEIDSGELVVFRSDGRGSLRKEQLDRDDGSISADGNFLALNEFEAISD